MRKRQKMKDRRLLLLTIMIFMEIIAIALFALSDLSQIRENYIVNISFDIYGMMSGIVILVCCIIGEKENRRDVNCFTMLVILTFTLMFTDEIAWLVDEVPELYWINIVDNTAYYAIAQILVCIFWYYVVEFIGKTEKNIVRLNYIISIGAGLSAILCVLNIKTKWFFSVDEVTGLYTRSKYNILSVVYMYFVMGVAFVTIIKKRKQISIYKVIAFMSYILLPVFVGFFSLAV